MMKQKIIGFLVAGCIGAAAIGIGACSSRECRHRGLRHIDEVSATCTAEGNIEYWHCDECSKNFADAEAKNQIDTVVIFATRHRTERVDAVTANCTQTGNVEYWHCSVCLKNFAEAGAVNEIQDVTIPITHQVTKVDALDADCTTEGNVEYWHCSGCFKNFAEAGAVNEIQDVTIPITHQVTKVEALDADCTTEGNIEHWHCGKCLKNFADEEAKEPLDNVKIPPVHSLGGYEYDYDNKKYVRVCSKCEHSEDTPAGTQSLPFLARDPDELKAVVAEAAQNSFIKLANDITVTYESYSVVYRLPEGGTLDLGGHTVTVTKSYNCFVVEGTNVTVQNGTVNLDNNNGSYGLFVGDTGDDNIVTVKNIDSNAGFNVFNCVATVIDCNVDASARKYYALWADQHSTINVESGTYVGGEIACVHSCAHPDTEEGNGNIILKGGTFTGNIMATVRTEIHGGTINGTVKLSIYKNCQPYLLVGKDYTETLTIVCDSDKYQLTVDTDENGNKIYQQKPVETPATA